MVRIAVLGASGQMGRRVIQQVLSDPALELAAAVAHPHSRHLGVDAATLAGLPPCGVEITAEGFNAADVVVDFALPEGTLAALPLLGDSALVTGTTGLSTSDLHRLHLHANRAPLLHASNFSTGINLLLALLATAASALPEFDIEIVEAHHRRKLDAPSGTALALANAAATAREHTLSDVRCDGRTGRTGPRPSGQIGLHAVRGGDIIGHHDVLIAGAGETIRLGHNAISRDTFAIGALRAARWIAGRPPGQYTMSEVLGLDSDKL